MIINEFLKIEVADSDVPYNRRFKNSKSKSSSETRSYYINDDPDKYNEIMDWFNGLSKGNVYKIDLKKTLYYASVLNKIILPQKHLFFDSLDDLEMDISNFKSNFSGDYVTIPALTTTGENLRYLKFDNSDRTVKLFRKLIIGSLTNIVVKKSLNTFFISLEVDSSKYDLIENNNVLNVLDRTQETAHFGYNKIYYGTPGSGKSYYVDKAYNLIDNIVHRTTFYPDYSNTDFIGQIMPKLSNNQVSYEFNPGVFSLALHDALKFPNRKIVLIIEEINRGNAAAIFGDVFQLLDRDESGKSRYSIRSPQIEAWLLSKDISVKKIFIPSNLFIVATMNTSDQNVFTLDTAFKRRWKMEYISNDFADKAHLEWFDWYIPGSKKTWREFVEAVNKKITDDQNYDFDLEDKRIGVYFVGPNELLHSTNYDNKDSLNAAKSFSYKVLQYIWEDVAKLNRNEWFKGYSTFDELIKAFMDSNFDDELDSLYVIKDITGE